MRAPPSRFSHPLDSLLFPALGLLVLWAPWSVRDASWVGHLDGLPWLALGGVTLGFLLARSHAPGLMAHLLSLVMGIEVVLLVFARVAEALPMTEGARWLILRVGIWLATILTGGASNDPLLFALSMGALAWLIGYSSAWWLFRDRAVWLPVAVNGLALLMNLSYAPPALSASVPLFLLNALLVLALAHYAERQDWWHSTRVRVERAVGRNAVIGTALAAAAVLSIAWALPPGGSNRAVTDGWDRVTTPWRNVERDFDRVFASLNAVDSGARGLNFGRTLAPRGAFELSDVPVLRVESPKPIYLRATTADRYTGQAITSSAVNTLGIPANSDLLSEDQQFDARDLTRITVRVLATRSSVAFTPDAPLRFSLPTLADMRGGPVDLASVRLESTLVRDEEYVVEALTSVATAQELRAAGEDYPESIRRLYLPDDRRALPGRVLDLTRQAAEGATPYDRAVALESYLRQAKTYSTRVPLVPADRDWVDYFLFDMDQGYCDFFSTSMAVMLRVVGVPARVAAGFAPGELDPATGTWLVRESHAHSWVEAYFPRYGWVAFEPSANRALPERTDVPSSIPTPTPVASPAAESAVPPALTPEEQFELDQLQAAEARQPLPFWLLSLLGMVLGFAVLAVILLGLLALAWRSGLGGLAAYQRPYAQLLRLANWTGVTRVRSSRTPFEMAEDLTRQAPHASGTIRNLTQAYVEGAYAGRPPAADPWPVWTAARRALARQFARQRLRRLIRRKPAP